MRRALNCEEKRELRKEKKHGIDLSLYAESAHYDQAAKKVIW
jgi:hypothetical protein